MFITVELNDAKDKPETDWITGAPAFCDIAKVNELITLVPKFLTVIAGFLVWPTKPFEIPIKFNAPFNAGKV